MATGDTLGEKRFTPRGRAARERIINAAAELILTDGLSTLSMRNVREAASVSGSQLAHYFTDKQTLIQAVITRQINVVLEFHRQPKLRGLDTFDDFERWIDLNMRYLRRIGYAGTPTYHALTAQLAKTDHATRQTLAAGYWQWIELVEQAIQRMKDRGVLVADANPRQLALVIVGVHQGGASMAFTYRQEWPHADAVRFAVNYVRIFAAQPAERVARPPRPPRGPARKPMRANQSDDGIVPFTHKGQATRARIVETTAALMFTNGVAGTTLSEVRNNAAVSGSQMSHYFPDKRDLTREVITARRNDVMAFHTQARLGALDSLDELQAWADACIADIDAVYCRGGCVYGSLAGELLEADDDILDDLAAGYDRWLELFRAGLTAMRRRGDLQPDANPRHLAVALVAAHQGGAMLTYATGSPEPSRAAVEAAVDYVRSFATRAKPRRSRTTSRRRQKSA